MVVLEYEDVVGDEVSRATVVVVVEDAEAKDASLPQSFQPLHPSFMELCRGKSLRMLFFRL